MPGDTPLRARLRAMAAAARTRCAGAWAAPADDAPIGGTLAWADARLVWRRAGAPVRVFSFAERVRAALGARMRAGAAPPAPALVVVLETTIVFYLVHSGEEFLQPLFFRPASVHALRPEGLLLVRAEHDGLARAFFVRHVLDDLAPWAPPFLRADEAVIHAGTHIVTAAPGTLRIYTYALGDAPPARADAPPPRKLPRRSSTRRRRSSRVRASEPPLPPGPPPAPAPPFAPFAQFARAHAEATLIEELAAPHTDGAHVVLAGADMYICAGTLVFVRGARTAEFAGTDVRAVALFAERADAVAFQRDGAALLYVSGETVVPPADAPLPARPACALVTHTLAALHAALGAPVVRAWLAARGPTEWDRLACMLGTATAPPTHAYARMCADARAQNTRAAAFMHAYAPLWPPPAPRPVHTAAPPALAPTPAAAVCLHLLATEACIDMRRRAAHVPRLAALAARAARALGWADWVDFWGRVAPEAQGAEGVSVDAPSPSPPTPTPTPTPSPSPTPLDIYDILSAALAGTEPSLAAAVRALPGGGAISPAWLAAFCPLATRVCAAYAPLARRAPPAAVVEAMLAAGLDARTLAALAPGPALPLEDAICACQRAPPAHWPPAAYALVRRRDAAAQAAATCTRVRADARVRRTLPADTPLDPLSAHLFAADDRLAEVARMLATHTPNAVHVVHPDDAADEAERQADALAAARAMAARTMALAVGRGMFRLASRPLASTGTWTTPRICLAVRTLPDGGTLRAADVADAAEREWPEFHNGVASALELAPRARVDSDWIFAHAGRRSSAAHAGFLLGLGLRGFLRTLGRVHAYRYLAPRHALTTTGLVLGLGASFRASADPAARQLMAVHAAAFLPAGSIPLRLDTPTQAAGLLGMGLVFAGTDHRWTAERLVTELEHPRLAAADPHRDAYMRAAGLALGLVCLARARRAPLDAPADAALITRLRRSHAHIPAMLALALIFLRSGRPDIDALLAPPPAAADLEHVRPDALLIRALARALVAADAHPSAAWLDAQLPPFLRAPPSTLTSAAAATAVPWHYMRAGACLALGLRLAGSADAHARALLLAELDTALAVDDDDAPASYAASILAAARTALRNAVHLALAAIMSGTGDVDVLRLLRVAHGHVSRRVSYGTHMATHMALGMLFLGGGRFALGTSDSALAALLIALVPPYAADPTDNAAHLQATRHLWALALEPRLIVARDVASGAVAVLPLSVRTPHAARRRTAPTLLPPLDTLAAVESVSRRYWPAALAADALRTHAAAHPLHTHILHVQRRTGYLSYLDDPHGYRSIFVRSSVPQRLHMDAAAAREAPATLADLLTLVAGFDTAAAHRALAERVCRSPAPLAVFLTSVLMECLAGDTPMLVRIYLALWDALHAADPLLARDVHLARASTLLAAPFLDLVLKHVEAVDIRAYLRGDAAHPSTRRAAAHLAALGIPRQRTLAALRARFAPAHAAALWHVAAAAHAPHPAAFVAALHSAWTQ